MNTKNGVRVYIACPYTKGDVAVNVKRSMDAFDALLELGYTPFNPLFTHFQHMAHPRPYNQWLELDMDWLYACDCILRLDGESHGADEEEKQAKEWNMKVFYSMDELNNFYNVKKMNLENIV